MKRFLLPFLLFLPGAVLPQAVQVTETTLANGLKVLLAENHAVPAVCFYSYFRVGSRNEVAGITGISHLFEHMMFNGSKKYPPGILDRILEGGGGYSNASTWNDFTNYVDEFNPDLLPKVLDIEADRMRALKLDTANIEQERGIVKEERRVSTDNDVRNAMTEVLYANAFVAHSYQHQVIGWMKDLDNIRLSDAQAYFRTYYAPNNAVVILTGDFDSRQALALIRKEFESIPAQPAPREPANAEPEQRGEKRIDFHKPAELPALMIGSKSVSVRDPDYYAADVLGQILGRGESSRLYRRLVYETRMCTDVSAGADEMLDPGLFTFYAQMKPGTPTASAEKEIDSICASIVRDGVTPEELQKAKNNAQADYVRRFATNAGTGFVLGYYEVLYGDYHKALTVAEEYGKVTRERVQAVAARIFNPLRRTVVTLIPSSGDDARR